MSPVSSTCSEPPPYSTDPPRVLDPPRQGQLRQQRQQEQQQQGQYQQGQGQQAALQHQQAQLAQQQQRASQLAYYQQYPTFPQSYIPQPQPQPFYYPPQFQTIHVPVYPIPGPVFYHSPYAAPHICQAAFQQPQPQPLQALTYQPIQPLPPAQPQQTPLPTQPQDVQNNNNNDMQIVHSTQAGFIPHPPAIIPGISGVHQYPLIVRKEGDGPPPQPVFIDGYAEGYDRQERQG
ncbi:uncharacterized protein K444DRAFT_636946 [Hyaloscypha bicolor E]|uniref:Uncharacterized protein n=1 Tax=Hyaloscypha bicolor E TaxID=1095630 RepID=A0A2J6SLS8_9HELO|nr:uncharacterized protein K444DRAFT_636946 [Hyaloscypha bicolor E]PMD51680.1 hypothetical protein K444DRAFT_636946 [Hyaloscypha bicolor E]